jgi:hypothetical protein
VQKLDGENGSYKLIIAVQYADGEWDRMSAVVFPADRKTYIMGERLLTW